MYSILTLPASVRIGITGTNRQNVIEIDISKWIARFPAETVYNVAVIRPGETKDDAYFGDATVESGILKWVIHYADVEKIGEGAFEVHAMEPGTDTLYAKSPKVKTVISESITDTAGEIPPAADPWVRRVEEAARKAMDAAVHAPIIGENGHWYTWDQQTGAYIDTGRPSAGASVHGDLEGRGAPDQHPISAITGLEENLDAMTAHMEDEDIHVTEEDKEAWDGKADLAYVQEEDNALQGQIDALVSKSDVVDVVGTYAELMSYDTSGLGENDVVKVLADETRSDARTYYRWKNRAWAYIGAEAAGYTKAETDALLNEKADADDVPEIDETLTQSGDAADAAAVGAKLGEKLNANQGAQNAGKALAVGSDGTVVLRDRDIVIVQYYVTTYANVNAAVVSGANVFCDINVGWLAGRANYVYTDSENAHYFNYFDGNGSRLVEIDCHPTTGWHLATLDVEMKANKTTAISASSTDAQYPSAKAVHTKLQQKQDAISDLATIRSGAAAGATALQSEEDPTVPSWAKQTSKPAYTASEIGYGGSNVAAELAEQSSEIAGLTGLGLTVVDGKINITYEEAEA